MQTFKFTEEERLHILICLEERRAYLDTRIKTEKQLDELQIITTIMDKLKGYVK